MCTVVDIEVHVCIRGIEEWAMYIIDSPLPVTFPAIVEAMNHHMSQGNNAYSFGYEVDQNIPSTPGHARAILYCAIAIELASYGLDHQTIPMVIHLRDMAQHCLDVAKPHFTSSRGMNSNNFANTAIQSAERAIKYFTRILSEHESKITRQFEEEREKQQFVKTQALNAIRGWLRNILFRRSIQLRLRRRNALSSFCRGTSSYAKQLQILKQATNPPVPTSSDPPTSSSEPSTSKADSHPFRHRALPLPPRNKKRRRGRKNRNRPPPKYRRENPITSSPSSHNLTPYTDAIQPTQPTASGRSFVPRTIVPRTDRISPKRRKTTKSNPSSFMPMCFWALQSRAFELKYTSPLSSTLPVESSISPVALSTPPDEPSHSPVEPSIAPTENVDLPPVEVRISLPPVTPSIASVEPSIAPTEKVDPPLQELQQFEIDILFKGLKELQHSMQRYDRIGSKLQNTIHQTNIHHKPKFVESSISSDEPTSPPVEVHFSSPSATPSNHVVPYIASTETDTNIGPLSVSLQSLEAMRKRWATVHMEIKSRFKDTDDDINSTFINSTFDKLDNSPAPECRVS